MDDDASRNGAKGLIQGYNSAAQSEPERGTGYIGPCPPDADHVYTLRVMALDFDARARCVETPWVEGLRADAARDALRTAAEKVSP